MSTVARPSGGQRPRHSCRSRAADGRTRPGTDSLFTMEGHAEKHRLSSGQLISVPHRDTIRLLEVFVKRSLSVNDGTAPGRRSDRKEKWVTIKQRRHSSDPALHLAEGVEDVGIFLAAGRDDACPEEPRKPKKRSKKNKKRSFWKNIVGFLSRKNSEDKEEEQDGAAETSRTDSTLEPAAEAAVTCLPTTPASSPKKSSRKKRRFSKRRLSLKKSFRSGKDLIAADISDVEAVTSVQATYSYYEKVSEELEKIVQEVKVKEEERPLSDEEVINRIAALTKVEGDAIENKMKDNPALRDFFLRMSYSSFQKLADAYLEKEASPPLTPVVLPAAPELVKLAFALDFTARVARLPRQNIGHVTGLGHRYLLDRFEYNQACTDHPWSETDD